MATADDVRIALLGGFVVSVGGKPVPDTAWRLRKAKTVIKLLALAPGHRLTWEQIGEVLWPDRDALAVRNNLYQALRAARTALASAGADGQQVLRLHDGLVAFGDDVTVVVDVDEFTEALEHARAEGSLDAHQRAAALFAGELLPEDRYEDWAEAPREALREQHSAVLLALAQLHRERGDPGAAIDVLRTLIRHHELHEPARRELMVLLRAAGRRQEALAEYEGLRVALRRSLEADPDPETRALYRRLLAGSLEATTPDAAAETEVELTAPVGGATRSDNLPAALSSFVGRGHEIHELERLLDRTRLLTLTGVGGAGKTRLAIEVARHQVHRFEHGVWLVDLAPLSEPGEVPRAVAKVLGQELPERDPPIPVLVEQLADRRVLVLLDNCEHLIAACAELVTAVLSSCPEVTVLATSREALRIEGETAWRVPSLALPDLHHLPDHTALGRQAAVQLFCERATAAEPAFALTARNARTVAELCVRLDGIPLALELAAARVRMLSPAQILGRLDEALEILTGGSRAALTRHQTLSATLDWSHDLLDDDERVVFRRLAVFAGSFSLEAAEHVCGIDPLRSGEVLALLGRLLDKSLVAAESHGDVSRYRLLETVRQYGRERLDGAGEAAAIAQRHRAWYCSWAEANDPERAAVGSDTLDQVDVEHDNLRAALRSALAEEPEAALRLAASLWRFWLTRGYFAEGRRWLEAALDANPQPTALRARGLIAIAVLDMRYAAGPDRLVQGAEQVVAIHEGIADPMALAQSLHLAAVLLWTAHRADQAEQHLDRACAMARDLSAHHILAGATHTRGVIALGRGQPAVASVHFAACEAALAHVSAAERGFLPAITIGFSVEWDEGAPRIVFEETLVIGHRLGAGPAEAYLGISQSWAARAAGDLDGAVVAAERAAAGFADQGWDYGVALAQHHLGFLHRLTGDFDRARRRLEHSLQLRVRLADRRATGLTLGGLGLLAAAEGDAPAAERYLQRALRLFERIEDGFAEAGTLLNLGVMALRAGDLDAARQRFEHIQRRRDAPGMRRTSAWSAVMLAEIADARDDAERAAEHLAEAHATFASLGEQMGLEHCDRLRLALRR